VTATMQDVQDDHGFVLINPIDHRIIERSSRWALLSRPASASEERRDSLIAPDAAPQRDGPSPPLLHVAAGLTGSPERCMPPDRGSVERPYVFSVTVFPTK